jgi:hypothetical protein
MAWQQVNCETAMHLSVELELDYLLHIDIDELFFPPLDGDSGLHRTNDQQVGVHNLVRKHFAELYRMGVYQMTYANMEAVVQSYTAMSSKNEPVDYFRHGVYFKEHPGILLENDAILGNDSDIDLERHFHA